MPSGKVHSAISLTAAVGGGAVLWAVSRDAVGSACFAGGCALGVLISPDLDKIDGNISHGVARNIAGLPGRLWRVIWLPYAVIPHRSPLSHAPLLGTAGRLLYLSVFFVPLYLLLNRIAGISVQLTCLWLYGLAGLVVSDALHWLADKTFN